MKAARIHEFGSPDVIRIDDVPPPTPNEGEILVRVAAAGVGPWDALFRERKIAVSSPLPLILGSDLSGVVEATGPGVTKFRAGDEVYGMTNSQFLGAYAQYALASEMMMAQKPRSLSFVEAASAPVVAVTAWQMLFDYAQAKAGQTVLIHGAGGNVGAYAVQMACNAGLEVFATASSKDRDYVRELGAATVIDYRETRFEDVVRAVDIVLDTVGGDTCVRSIGVLKPGGILVSVVSSPMPEDIAAKAGVRAVYFIVDVTTDRLNTIAELFDSKKLVPQVGTVLPLADAHVAHQMLAGAPHKRGKIVLNVAALGRPFEFFGGSVKAKPKSFERCLAACGESTERVRIVLWQWGDASDGQRRKPLWVATADLPKTAAHPFYRRLNELLDEHGFDAFAERCCEKFYSVEMGRPSLAPGIYFRSLLIGYFEGLDSERLIAWRLADSISLRRFVAIELDESTPDHSTISRTRRLIDVETHREMFTWVLQVIAQEGMLKGGTIAVDATTLEANAALRSIVRRDTGERYEEFLKRLALESGIETPTREQLAQLDKKRKNKGSNDDWTHPQDPDAKIGKMKDGRTHLAHKAEQAVDLETGAVLAVTLEGAGEGDTSTLAETVMEAAEQLARVATNSQANEQLAAGGLQELVADKGYHSNEVMEDLAALKIRSYISEPDRGRRRWRDKATAQAAVYGNRRRIRGERGKRLLRRRGERVERGFAHLYETGGMRRTHLRGHPNILKRLLIHVGAFNLSLVLRKKLGAGTPRGLAALKKAVEGTCEQIFEVLGTVLTLYRGLLPGNSSPIPWTTVCPLFRFAA